MKKLTAEDMETNSSDIMGDNIERLKILFPEAFSEGKIDFEVLKQLLGSAIDEREEKYGLNWHGKRRARHPVHLGRVVAIAAMRREAKTLYHLCNAAALGLPHT